MSKLDIKKLDINQIKSWSDSRKIITGLLSVALFSIIAGTIFFYVQNPPEKDINKLNNKELIQRVDSLAKRNDCTKGLEQVNRAKLEKFDNTAKTKIFDYQMQCNAFLEKYDESLAAAGKLMHIYNIDKKETQKQFVAQYIEQTKANKANLQNTQNQKDSPGVND